MPLLFDPFSGVDAPGESRFAVEGRVQRRVATVHRGFNFERFRCPVGSIAHLGAIDHDIERPGYPAAGRDRDAVASGLDRHFFAADHIATREDRVTVGRGRGFLASCGVRSQDQERGADTIAKRHCSNRISVPIPYDHS